MTKQNRIARAIWWAWCCSMLVFGAVVPAQADVIEAYVRPNDPNYVGPCPLTHVIFDACTGLESFAAGQLGVDLDVPPCTPVLLDGIWGSVPPGCPAYIVREVLPTAPACAPQPRIRAERVGPARYEFTWDRVPCVETFDFVGAYLSVGTQLSMDQFSCGLGGDNFGESGTGTLSVTDPDPVPGMLNALLVRGQQGPLATDHYGAASSGEERRPASDCDVDLSPPAAPPGRTVASAITELVP